MIYRISLTSIEEKRTKIDTLIFCISTIKSWHYLRYKCDVSLFGCYYYYAEYFSLNPEEYTSKFLFYKSNTTFSHDKFICIICMI